MLQRLLIIATLAAGTAIGLMWPTKNAANPAATSEIRLEKSYDGQFYTDAKVDGQPTRFLIDTGASDIALSEADARRAGISINPAGYELIGDGASGVVRGQHVQIREIDLDGLHAQNVNAVVLPGTQVSLLGQPFLDKLDEIVIQKGQMRLRYSVSS